MTANETARVLAVLSAAYPWRDLPEATLRVYARHLEDVPYAVGQAAAALAIDTCRYFPSVAELRELVVRLLVTDQAPTADEAWGELMRHLQEGYGAWRPPQWSHDLVRQAADTLQWDHGAFEVDLHNPVARRTNRAAFLRVYRALLDRAVHRVAASSHARRLQAALPSLEPGERPAEWELEEAS